MMQGGGKYTTIDSQQLQGSVPAVPDPPPVTVKFTDSNLQTFPPSQAQGKITGGSRPPRDADDSFSKPASGSSDEPQQGGWLRNFAIATYKPYFDVDTSDVLERIIDSLFPFRGTFNEKTSTNPDLYGPFWICTTLIFVAASMGTFVTYIAHKLKDQKWDYDINLVTWSAGLFYGYVTIIPLCLYVILKYFSVPAGLVQLFCLYGYSLFVFIPALCLSIVPLEMTENWNHTALLVIDMQKDFIEDESPVHVKGGKDVVPNVIKAVEIARQRGILIVWVVREHDPLGRDVELFRRHLYAEGKVGPTSKGTEGAELVDGLVIKEGDYKVVKTRFSAFFSNTNPKNVQRSVHML